VQIQDWITNLEHPKSVGVNSPGFAQGIETTNANGDFETV